MEGNSLHDRLKARLALVRSDLEEVMGRLGEGDMPFAPADGMRTIGGQLAEIAATETQVMSWLKEGKTAPWQEVNASFERGATLSGLKETLAKIREETLQYLESLSDDELETPIAMPKGWFESLNAETVPPSEVFRSIAQHEWYHVGQLVSYQWFRGDDPYKW